MVFIVDLQKMILGQFHQYVDWDQSKEEQGNWPTKTMVSMCFRNETNLATMIGATQSCYRANKRKILQTSGSGGHCKIGAESSKETLGEGACPVSQGTESKGKR